MTDKPRPLFWFAYINTLRLWLWLCERTAGQGREPWYCRALWRLSRQLGRFIPDDA